MNSDGTECVWFHLLCKDVAVEGNRIVNATANEENTDSQDDIRIAAQQQSQANFSWLKPGFVLKMRKPGTSQPLRTNSSSSDSTLATPSTYAQVELFCFGAPSTVRDRFRKLMTVASSDDLIQDPYLLLEIVFEEMYKVLDRAGWVVGNIFGTIETVMINMSYSIRLSTKDTLANTGNGRQARNGDQGAARRPFYRTPQSCKAYHISARKLRIGLGDLGRFAG